MWLCRGCWARVEVMFICSWSLMFVYLSGRWRRPTVMAGSSLPSPLAAPAGHPKVTSTLSAAILKASWSLTGPKAPPTAAWTAWTYWHLDPRQCSPSTCRRWPQRSRWGRSLQSSSLLSSCFLSDCRESRSCVCVFRVRSVTAPNRSSSWVSPRSPIRTHLPPRRHLAPKSPSVPRGRGSAAAPKTTAAHRFDLSLRRRRGVGPSSKMASVRRARHRRSTTTPGESELKVQV